MKRIYLKNIVKVSAVVLPLLFFIAAVACQSKADETQAPNFSLLNLQGDLVSLSDYKGKVVLVNFFATYCPPCRLEMTDFVELQKEYGPKGFIILAISVDQNPQIVLPRFIRAMKLNFPVLIATSKVIKDYGNIYGLPVTFVIDKDQRIMKRFMGMVTRDMLVPLIEKGLGPQS